MPKPFKYKDAIVALLEENPIHPTVDWIHGQLREDHPRVSLATVYRTLRLLVADGTLCELPFGTSESRFGLAMDCRDTTTSSAKGATKFSTLGSGRGPGSSGP